MKAESLLTTSHAARLLGCSSETIRVWARQRKIKFSVTASGVRLFRERDLRRLKQLREGAGGEDFRKRGKFKNGVLRD